MYLFLAVLDRGKVSVSMPGKSFCSSRLTLFSMNYLAKSTSLVNLNPSYFINCSSSRTRQGPVLLKVAYSILARGERVSSSLVITAPIDFFFLFISIFRICLKLSRWKQSSRLYMIPMRVFLTFSPCIIS